MSDVTSASTALSPDFDHRGRRPFQSSELIAERFRVVRQVGEGSMGIVYEVIDEKLNERRALKCAKPGFASHLSPEARHALRVTHRNVCRLFEIYSVQSAAGVADFLTMEFLDGPTLSRHNREHGKLPLAEARDIALQICAGLDAAHKQNLLHRDLKSNNVVLTRDAHGKTRAVVTDFGLAEEPSSPDSSQLRGSEAGAPAGTAAYVAPERWRGARATVASDIYSLGVLLHELIAGERPIVNSDSSTTLAPDLPRRWRRIIARCLNRDPIRRYASAAHVADAIADRHAVRRVLGWTALALVPLAYVLWLAAFPTALAARLAILPFEVDTSDAEAVAFARHAATDVSTRLTNLRPRPPQLVVLPVEESEKIETRDIASASGHLGASHVLQASVTRRGSRLLVRAVIVDATTNVPLGEWSGEHGPADASLVAAAIVAEVAARFRLPRQTGVDPISPAAYALYSEGSSALRRGSAEYPAAVDAFRRAAAADPESVLPQAGLAQAYYDGWVTTSDRKWLTLADEALKRAQSLDADSLVVRLAAGRVNLVPGSYSRAADEYLRATQLDPTNAEAWLGLARAYQGMQDRDNDAARAFAKAIEVQPGYYRPFIDFGAFYRRLGNYSDAEKQWLEAVRLAPDLLSGHSNLALLYSDMGRYAEAEKAFARALEIDPRARVPLGNLGALLQYMGRDEDALAFLERARKVGPDSHILLLNVGDSYRRLGRTREAEVAYREARALAEPILLSNPRDAATRAFIAYFALRLGDQTTAERELTQALSLGATDRTVIRRAVICYEALGQRDRALTVLESAPGDVVHELSRQPDLTDLRKDPRFSALLSRK
jgi:serine/threonine protein kinase/tetratricopeptide (TPR) repeat protein